MDPPRPVEVASDTPELHADIVPADLDASSTDEPSIDEQRILEFARPLPYREDFRYVEEGALPVGWTGDAAIGVRTDSAGAWLQSSASDSAKVAGPALPLQEDFELEFHLTWDSRGKFSVGLLTSQADAPVMFTVSTGSFGCSATLSLASGRETETIALAPQRIRLVRWNGILRIIVRDQIVFETPSVHDFRRFELSLSGDHDRAVRVRLISATEHVRNLPPRPFAPFQEDYLTTPEGQLPYGWSGDSFVSVHRLDQVACLENTSRSLGRVRAPDLVFPADFTFTCDVDLPEGATITMHLEGAGNTPDLTASFHKSGFHGQLEVRFTNAATQRATAPERLVRLRLDRKSGAYRVMANDATVLAQRMPEFQDFRSVAFEFPGGNYPSRLINVCLRPFTDGPVPSLEVPERTASSSKSTGLSGRWRTGSGSILEFEDKGDEVLISLISSEFWASAFGKLTRDGELLRGDLHVVYTGDKRGRAHALPLIVRVEANEAMRVRAKVPTLNKNGNKTGDRVITHLWTRQNPDRR